ncbi:MAG: response regulator transcription factor [Clostridia bacterium]|nr:response regulator transcription factor [Clostridia bacterium]
MLIALCDDERAENKKLTALIEAYALRSGCDIRCRAFTSPSELLGEERFDLYLLDYFMGEMNGVELAKRLNEKFGGAVTVCYLTNYENAAVEIINNRVYADGFLKKPVDEAALYEKLDAFYKSSLNGRIELKRGGVYETLYAQDILYAEASGKKTVLHLFGGTRDYNRLISELAENELSGAQFFRIHRSFLVNMQHVVGYDAKSVTMKNGDVLSLKSKEFQSAYRRFIFRNG